MVLNGSPRKNGNTEIMADAFIRGAGERGNSIAVFRVCDMKIKPCIDCGACTGNSSRCIQNDDFTEVLRLIDSTDMLVLASPVYWWGFPGQLKNAIDRLHSKSNQKIRVRRSALLLNAYDEDAFDPVIDGYVRICRHFKWEIADIVAVGGMTEKGKMRSAPQLAKVFALGKSIH